MNAKIGAVGAQLLSRDGEVDGLQERVRRRVGLRLGRGRPVPEREESYVFHTGNLCFSCRFATVTVSGAAPPSHRARTRLLVAVMRGDANFGGRPLAARDRLVLSRCRRPARQTARSWRASRSWRALRAGMV